MDKNHGKERRRSKLKDELDELFAASDKKWHRVPITINHHKWWLHRHRGDGGEFFFSFVSPAGRRYTYYVDGGGIVAGADIASAKGVIASYYRSMGDKYDKLDAVLMLTPKHVIKSLFMLLDIIKQRFDELHDVRDLFKQYAPAGAELLDYIRWHDEYIVFYRDTPQYIIQHLTDSGLYYGHYYDDARVAYQEFCKLQ